jgi:hypothetical protein
MGMRNYIGAIFVALFLAIGAHAQTARQLQSSDVTTALGFTPPAPSGTFAAGDLIVGASATAIKDSVGTSTCGSAVFFACALPNRFQIGTASNTSSLWPDTMIAGTSTASQIYSITGAGQASAGYIGGSFNTRTSDAATDGGGVTEGVQILAVNDRTTGVRSTWGLYIQAMYPSTVAGTQIFGSEFSISNNNTAGIEDPFTVNHSGWAHGLRLDCIDAGTAGGSTSNNCQNAIDIVNNGKQFSSGIVFGTTALDTATLTNPPAISLPSNANGYGIYWYTSAATPKWKMFSVGTDSNTKSIRYGNNIISYLDESGTIDLSLSVASGGQVQIGGSSGANCGNYVQLNGQGNGSPAQITAQGCSDANTQLELQGKTALGGVKITGHHLTKGTAPTVGTCGTGTVVANSTDAAGQIIATGATACTVTFNVAYTNAPFCTVSDNTTAAGLKVTLSAASITVSGLTSGDTFSYICVGQTGG